MTPRWRRTPPSPPKHAVAHPRMRRHTRPLTAVGRELHLIQSRFFHLPARERTARRAVESLGPGRSAGCALEGATRPGCGTRPCLVRLADPAVSSPGPRISSLLPTRVRPRARRVSTCAEPRRAHRAGALSKTGWSPTTLPTTRPLGRDRPYRPTKPTWRDDRYDAPAAAGLERAHPRPFALIAAYPPRHPPVTAQIFDGLYEHTLPPLIIGLPPA